MCCGWWKKIVSAAFNVPISTYQKLEALLASPTIRSVTLTVCDSAFDKNKAQYLYNMLSRSNVKGFNFTNIASPNNY
jgi:NADH/NAD ratio-sensing transcriptional regulator Rex